MIVVTGGAGFIGSNLIAGLEAHGRRGIVVCDRLGTGGKWRNLARRDVAAIIAPEKLIAFLDDAAGPIEAVFHLASLASEDVDLMLAQNFHASAELWAWCAANDVRLIYASTAETYGDGAERFDDDVAEAALARLRPVTAYAWTRHLFDRAVARTLAAGAPRPPQWAGLKLFDVYGPDECHKGENASLPLRLWRALAEPRAAIGGGGAPGAARDHVWVGDCVAVMLWLLETPAVSGLFNLGTGEARDPGEVAEIVGAVARRDVDAASIPAAGTQYFSQADVSRLREAGYRAPFTPIEVGVARYVRDFLAAEDPYL